MGIKLPGGSRYVYADSRSQTFRSGGFLNETDDGAVASTLKQVYRGGAAVNYALWNDQPPGQGQASSRGHTKGVIGFDESSGFWLIHSVPLYPAFSRNSNYPGCDNQVYGQSFLCISLTIGGINEVGKQLQNYNPMYYASNIESSMEAKVADLVNSISGDHNHDDSSIMDIKSKGGRLFTNFAKPNNDEVDIYNVLISPHYKVDTLAETWMNGRNPMPSYCKPKYDYSTMNIRQLHMGGVSWSETQDHSKWAIGVDGSTKGLVCIGGLNRQESQAGRYGGSLCFLQQEIHDQLNSAIEEADQC